REVVEQHFGEWAAQTGRSAEAVAEGFIDIAVQQVANAIKKISVARGYDVTRYTMQCFGGAGGQHACRVADALGMKTVFIHPLAGVLSAYGMGLADLRVMREKAVEAVLEEKLIAQLGRELDALVRDGVDEMRRQGLPDAQIEVQRKLHLKYEGTDS